MMAILICMHYIFAKILGRYKKERGHNQFVQFIDSVVIALVLYDSIIVWVLTRQCLFTGTDSYITTSVI